MRALLLDAERMTAHVSEVHIPKPAPNELLIRVEAVALNPADSLYMFNPLGSTGRVIGSDFAGVVEILGDAIPAVRGLKVGTPVAGFLQGACSINERPGAFQEYLVCPWDLVWQVGNGMRIEDAAVISLCGLTAAQALFYRMDLEAPFRWRNSHIDTGSRSDGQHKVLSIFVYGATTSVAMYAAQLVRQSAKASGRFIKLFGTASPRHFNMLKAEPYCYDEVVDYHSNDWPTRILDLTDGKGVDYAYDCISEGSTVAGTGKTLAPNGQVAIVRSREGGAWTAAALPIEPSYGAVWEGLGEDVEYQGMTIPASVEARAFAVAFYKYLSEGAELAPNPIRAMPGSLDAIVDDGLRLLGSGTMDDRKIQSDKQWMRPLSAEKMVYKITSG
jgi:NADPH:quinone reductase-like Zn-dependent oxidoreductase